MNWQDWSLPTWAASDDAKAFIYGFFVGASVRIWRAGARWLRKYLDDRDRGE